MSLLRSSPPRGAIEMVPLVAACVGLLLAAAPLFDRIAGWAVVVLLIAGGARLFANRRASLRPSLALKVALFGLSAAGIAMSYGTMVGVEPGLSILTVLVALKLLETDGERDFHILILLGYFLGLCDLFFSQDLLLWLYVGGVFVVLTATLVRFHRGPGVPRALVLSGTLLVQAAPIVVLLFLLFPRSNATFRFQFYSSLMRGAGMSDQLAPGSVASLALNPEIAFRVDFPDHNPPPISEMYWRGAVLWRGNGLTWVPGPLLPLGGGSGQLAGPAIIQDVSLRPHGGRWIFALDRPVGDSPRFILMPGGYYENQRPIFNTIHYRVTSRPENRELNIPAAQLNAALAPTTNPSPRVRALVDGWRAGAAGPREIVDRALRHFRDEAFSYSLEPGTYGDDALEDFLFQRRVGFCEHYAAAFATLMRVAGIPSRVVLGYHGGELNNRLGNSYVIVRQSDAHAWAEVWIKDRGWQRVDPTEVIAPDRISSGFASYRESLASADPTAAGSSNALLGWREVMRDVRLVWDSLNHQWDLHVLNFDEDEQRSFLAVVGLSSDGLELFIALCFSSMLPLGILWLWLQRSGRSPLDETGRQWDRFCRALARAGLHREPWEGPMHFGQRAAAAHQQHSALLLRIAELYTRLRYAPTPPAPRELAEAVNALPRLR